MRKRNLLLILGLLAAGMIAVWFLPSLLRAIPTRYAMRLPEPLQAMALPGDPTPILPTAAAPVSAAGLLNSSGPLGTATPPPSPTPVAVAGGQTAASPQAETLPATLVPTLSPTATPRPIPPAARLTGFSHIYQEWNNCGPATLAMTLTYFGLGYSQQDTAAALRPNPEDRNVTPEEMAGFVNDQTELRAIARANGDRVLLQQLLANNIPVIIEVGIEPPGEYRWLGWYGHYLLPVAYDDASAQFWVYDSWLGTSEVPQTNADPNGRILTYDDLDIYWPQFNRNYIVIYRPDQAALVTELVGDALDDATMWADSLAQAQLDAARNPGNPFYWFNLGTTHNALGQYDKAATAFDQARALGLPWRMLWYQFGPYEAYYNVGRYEDVTLLAETTLKDRPFFEESYYYLGLAQNALQQPEAGRENLERAHAFNPNYEPAEKALAELATPGG